MSGQHLHRLEQAAAHMLRWNGSSLHIDRCIWKPGKSTICAWRKVVLSLAHTEFDWIALPTLKSLINLLENHPECLYAHIDVK